MGAAWSHSHQLEQPHTLALSRNPTNSSSTVSTGPSLRPQGLGPQDVIPSAWHTLDTNIYCKLQSIFSLLLSSLKWTHFLNPCILEEAWSGSQLWICLSAFPLVGCVTAGKCPNLPEPLFLSFFLTVKLKLERPQLQKRCWGVLNEEMSVESPALLLLEKVLCE